MNVFRREFTEIGCKVITGAVTGIVIIKSLVKNSIAAADLLDEENYDWNYESYPVYIKPDQCN